MSVQVLVKEKKKEEKEERVRLGQLFRYADWGDWFLMAIGTVFAIGNGATLPLLTIFFGDIIEALVIYNGTAASKDALDSSVKKGNHCYHVLATLRWPRKH